MPSLGGQRVPTRRAAQREPVQIKMYQLSQRKARPVMGSMGVRGRYERIR